MVEESKTSKLYLSLLQRSKCVFRAVLPIDPHYKLSRTAEHVALFANSSRTVTEEEVLKYCDRRRKELVTGDRNNECLDVVRQLVAYLFVTQIDIR